MGGEGTKWLFGPNGTRFAHCHFRAQKSLDFQGPTLTIAIVMDIARFNIIISRAIETTGTLIVNISTSVQGRTFLTLFLSLSSIPLLISINGLGTVGQSDSNKIHQSRNQDLNCGCQIPLSSILKPNS
jgi:hypothetical protein